MDAGRAGGGFRVGGAPTWTKEVVIFLASAFFLTWPLMLNGAPFYSEDSPSYLRGGHFGFDAALLILDHWLNPAASAVAGAIEPRTIVAQAVAQSGGVRSIIYSLATYLLRMPGDSLLLLTIAQAGAVALVISILRRLVAPNLAFWPCVAFGGAVAVLTTAAWYAAYAVPDVLAGVAIAGIVGLIVFFDRLTLPMRVSLVLLIALCVTAHSSHVLLALGVIVAGAIADWWIRRLPLGLDKLAWFASPMILAVAALLGTSYLAFGELSIAPKRYPIQIARSVADGPGAWYLRDHCATEHYAICEIFGTNPPPKVGDFLWSKTGVRYRASPEQMERIRAEESTIVRRAAMEYPAVQIRRSVTNTFSQLFKFGVSGLRFGVRMAGGEDPALVHAAPDQPILKKTADVIVYLTFFASVVLLIALRRRLTCEERAAISIVVIGLVANAAVCGILSAVTDRYQGRVAWVLPALTLLILLRMWTGNRPDETSANVTLA